MADDRDARIGQLEAELRQLRERYALAEAKIDSLLADVERRDGALNEALEQQAATANVLRLIASSPADLQHVLDGIIEIAARVCDAPSGSLQQVRERDGRLAGRAVFGVVREQLTRRYANPFEESEGLPLTRGTVSGRAILERRAVSVADLADAVQEEFPESRPMQERFGHRSQVSVPLLRPGDPIGVLSLQRFEARPFTERQISLLETFADQAVIAIENARLFQELEQRNCELSEALEQQTATAEVLRVIASSPTDVRLVLDTIARTAARLCRTDDVLVHRADGDLIWTAAHYGEMGMVSVIDGRGWPD